MNQLIFNILAGFFVEIKTITHNVITCIKYCNFAFVFYGRLSNDLIGTATTAA